MHALALHFIHPRKQLDATHLIRRQQLPATQVLLSWTRRRIPTSHSAPGGSRLVIANTRRSYADLPPACEHGEKQLQRSGHSSATNIAAQRLRRQRVESTTREGVRTGVHQKYLKWASLLAAQPDPKSARLLIISSQDKLAPPII